MKNKTAIFFAILAAIFYSLSIPISKLLLIELPSTMLAGLLYLGAGCGMSLLYPFSRLTKEGKEEASLEKSDIKYLLLMLLLDVIASVMLLFAVEKCSPSSVSLLSNFEIVATSLFALFLFKEKIGPSLWIGIGLITLASILLSFDFKEGVSFSLYSLLALGARLSYGLENNCTKAISSKNPFQIVIIKGLFSGIIDIIIALIIGQRISNWLYAFYALLLGFGSYGLSVFFYVLAQRSLGASKTSSCYALAPFLGTALSFIIFKETPYFTFYIALSIMVVGLIFVTFERRNKTLKEKENLSK